MNCGAGLGARGRFQTLLAQLQPDLFLQPECGAAEDTPHDAVNDLVLRDDVSAAAVNSRQTHQQRRQRAAAAQQQQPLAAKEALALQRREHGRALGQHGPDQRRVVGAQEHAQRQAAAADDEKGGCGAQQG